MNQVVQKNIGALVDVVTSVRDAAASAGTVNGVTIDRALHNMPLSCVLHADLDAITGTPTATTVSSTLQHAPDGATWTNYTDPNTGVAATTANLTAANTENQLAVDLTLAYRYLRVNTTVAFTGGSSPTAMVGARLVLAGEPELPAV
jgi:hypothetical protein